MSELNSQRSATNNSRAIFAVTSQGKDFYSAMTRIAIASLRLSNPGLTLVVACDRDTDCAVRKVRDPLIDEVDEWLVAATPPGDAGFRNRFVKTSLRLSLDGPFLFLDSDIFVRGDLSEIFTIDTDIAGARNHSRMAYSEQMWVQDAATLKAMGWKTDKEVYINGGVLFCNDTPGTRRFAAEWRRRWIKCFDNHANHRDQPALNSALYSTQPRLTVLPDRYNAQFKVTTAVVPDAVLWHYYSSAGDVPHTRFELLVNDLVRGGSLDMGRIAAMLESGHPWRRDSVIDDWAAAGVVQRGRFDGWESAWLQREFGRYVLGRVRGALRRIKRTVVQW